MTTYTPCAEHGEDALIADLIAAHGEDAMEVGLDRGLLAECEVGEHYRPAECVVMTHDRQTVYGLMAVPSVCHDC